ncbi:uncharacterized protein [Macaca fascicularis]|uniref:uncharacterized protein n=1 Tax=Macaca fascicularis TaxID=9541 RepID=UPI003D159276
MALHGQSYIILSFYILSHVSYVLSAWKSSPRLHNTDQQIRKLKNDMLHHNEGLNNKKEARDSGRKKELTSHSRTAIP